jgi:HEAT repeat protein
MLSSEDIAQQLHLLNTYRQTLSICLQQRAMHGAANVPPATVHTINDCRANIRRIKKVLRQSSVEVEDLPNDEDAEDISALLESIEEKLASASADDRIGALMAVARFRLQQHLQAVIDLLLHDKLDTIRERAAWTLDYLNNPDALPALIQALHDPSWSVRSNAGWALVHLGHIAVPAVQRVLSESPNQGAREMAVLVLERI